MSTSSAPSRAGWAPPTSERGGSIATEASLAILAYNIQHAIAVAGVASTLKVIAG